MFPDDDYDDFEWKFFLAWKMLENDRKMKKCKKMKFSIQYELNSGLIQIFQIFKNGQKQAFLGPKKFSFKNRHVSNELNIDLTTVVKA